MNNTTIPGHCSCGAVHYEMTAPPLIVHACHCRMCQRLSGGAFAVNALVEAHNVRLLVGHTHDLNMVTPSGLGQVITRCVHCQTAIWSVYNSFNRRSNARIKFVRAGTLVWPETVPPDVHIFTSTRQAHAHIPTEALQFTSFYDLKQVWGLDSLNRLNHAASYACR